MNLGIVAILGKYLLIKKWLLHNMSTVQNSLKGLSYEIDFENVDEK
jgi:hypothetical protein